MSDKIRHRAHNRRPGSGFLTVPEVADELRVSRMHVYRLIERGELAAVRTGRLIRVYENALQDYLSASLIGDEEVSE